VFVPESDSVAAPVFTRTALVPEMTPLKVPVPDATFMVPEVVKLILLAAATPELRARVVPLAMDKELVPSPALFPNERVPAANEVVPE
jgi:hypothetical protein